MPRLAVPFGLGIDRQEGALTVNPAQASDARNVIFHSGSVRARGGLEPPVGGAVWTDAGASIDTTDVLDIFPFLSQTCGIGVAYNRSTRVLSVWSTTLQGGDPTYLGTWATLGAGAPLPKVVGAEADGKFFLAHEEVTYNFRAKTIYVDAALALQDLTADLDSDGSANQVHFRGVCRYLKFLVGWGYGTDSDANRPDVVRLSLPGQPTSFLPNHYVLGGPKQDQVVACVPGTDCLVILKSNAWLPLLGTNAATFQPGVGEDGYGAEATRLAIGVNGMVYFWSAAGPRVTTGLGPSTDIGEPLDMDEAEPSDLPTLGPAQYGFTVFDPIERQLRFAFPNTTRAGGATRIYTLSMRGGQPLRWSYDTLQKPVLGGHVLASAPATSGPITAYASALTFVDGGTSGATAGYRKGTIGWTNNSASGDEDVEVYWKPTGGAWGLLATVPSAGTSYVKLNFDALTGGSLAVRFVRSGVATPGYEGMNPDAWTAGTAAGSKGTYALSATAPVVSVNSWARTSATETKHALTWTQPEVGVGFEIDSSNDGTTWGLLTTIAAAGNPRAAQVLIPNADLGDTLFYRMRAVRGSLMSATGASDSLYAGFLVTPVLHAVYQSDLGSIGVPPTLLVLADAPTSGYGFAVDVATSGAGPWGTPVTGSPLGLAIAAAALAPTTSHVRGRCALTSFGVTDYGPASNIIAFTPVGVGAIPGVPTGMGGVVQDYTAGVSSEVDVSGWSNTGTGLRYACTYYNDAGGVSFFDIPESTAVQTVTDAIGGTPSPFRIGNSPDAFERVTGMLYRLSGTGAGTRASPGEPFIPGNAPEAPIIATVALTPNTGPSFLTQPTPGVGTLDILWGLPGGVDSTFVMLREDALTGAAWTQIANPAAPTDTYQKTGLSLGVTYRVRLMTQAAGGKFSTPVEGTITLT